MPTKQIRIDSRLLGVTFGSASAMRGYAPRALIALIREQPGYSCIRPAARGISLAKCSSGGIRLFLTDITSPGFGWMDASLADLPVDVA